ncbi:MULTISPECIES: hypothetical protein [unclassified Streptomyces]|uniref:hypothetical protein n=1 Tax=unclassified Streptomyces TaxID=2593676 RepID=UPI002257F190|nr:MULTISPECIES: hypothetical protein [unclassified Streptomyces]MCX4991884.1 hypothetical protein [Streptomyces sp. NBC_00568]MCX5002880.1 hypothetical protein [Streptomyces sp. NBC_00638]
MSAHTHTRPHPATTGRVDIRLPWWALALPVLAFVTLLLMILNPADAHAAGSDPAITHMFERIQQAVLNNTP